MTTPKYIKNSQALADQLLKQHGLNHRFNRTSITGWMGRNNISDHSIHHLCLTGCLKHTGKGEYMLLWHNTDLADKLRIALKAYQDLCAENSNKSKVATKPLPRTGQPRTEGIKEGHGTPIIHIRPTEGDAIALLKSLGYKIMKPVQQFEEV